MVPAYDFECQDCSHVTEESCTVDLRDLVKVLCKNCGSKNTKRIQCFKGELIIEGGTPKHYK